MSGIWLGGDKECCNLALFFNKQQQVAHHAQLVCLSFIWQEALVPGLSAQCQVKPQKERH